MSKFNENFDKIFKPSEVKTARYRIINGRITQVYSAPREKRVFIHGSIDPYLSPVSGKVIETRKQHRNDMKANNCRHYEGREQEQKYADIHNADKDKTYEKDLGDCIERAAQDIKYNNTPVEKGPLTFDL